MTLTDKEAKLVAALLDIGGDNTKAMNDHNGTPADHDPAEDHSLQADWCLMHYFAAKLRGDTK